MLHPIYSALLAQACSCPAYEAPVERVCIGQVWTLVSVAGQTGLCMTPPAYTRTLPWSGDLVGKPASELIDWLSSWQAHEAVLAVATLNAVLKSDTDTVDLITRAQPLGGGNLAVFRSLSEGLGDSRVCVIGRYPGLDGALANVDYACIERLPAGEDLPDPAAEYILPSCDWAFVTASALANKTLPRLLELSSSATTVLMGPSMPWSCLWAAQGVDYLAGVEVIDPDWLWRVAAEGGGTRIFEGGVGYRLLPLTGGECH